MKRVGVSNGVVRMQITMYENSFVRNFVLCQNSAVRVSSSDMNEKYKKSMIFVLFVLIAVASLGIFVLFARFLGFGGGIDSAVTVPISGPVTIGEDGVTFTPDESLRITRTSGKVLLRSQLISDANLVQGTLLLKDGSTRKVSISLEDASGREYVLILTSVGSAIGFGFSENDSSSIDKNISFRSVRIRSDKPVAIDALEWYSWMGK